MSNFGFVSLAILLVLGCNTIGRGQTFKSETDLNLVFERAEIAGAAMALITAEKPADFNYYGVKNAETNEPIDPETLFEVASLSKPVFAQLVVLLAEKDIINLGTPLVQYLPMTAVPDKRIETLTARHVLMHSTGFPNWFKKPENNKLKFAPGSKFGYSGEAYQYLQRVVEHITGKRLNSLCEEWIFQPLNMKKSSFHFNDLQISHADPHNRKGDLEQKKLTGEFSSAASSLHSTVDDYTAFLVDFAKTVEPSENLIAVDEKHGLFWGLGYGIEISDSDTLIWHWGNNWETFRSVFAYSLVSKTGYVLLTNSENGHRVLEAMNHIVFAEKKQFPSWLGYKQIRLE